MDTDLNVRVETITFPGKKKKNRKENLTDFYFGKVS